MVKATKLPGSLHAAKLATFCVWGIVSPLALLAATGCDKASNNLPPTPALVANDTPEGKLARVMQRLDDAIDDAKAQTGSGVVSEREAFSRLIRPDGEDGPYEAVITIETTRALAPAALNARVRAKLEAEAAKSGEPVDKNAKPLIVKDTQQTVSAEFPLVYEQEKWKLKKEIELGPDGEMEIERILFNYALK